MEILFENNNLIAINKPAGVLVHDDGSEEESIVSWVQKEYPELKDVGEDVKIRTGDVVKKPGIVHRLDRETSGVLLIAKNQESFLNLKKQFQEHQVEKTYQVFVYGNVKEDELLVDRPIGKSRSDFRMYSAQRGARGVLREAQTTFKTIKRCKEVSLLEAYPKTGRTHQIRVHLKAIHHGVVGDKLYSPKGEKMLGFERLALHARSIKVKDLDGLEIAVEAPYPEDFKNALAELETLC